MFVFMCLSFSESFVLFVSVCLCLCGCVSVRSLVEVCVCTYGTVNIYFHPLLDAETYCKSFLLMGGWFKRYFVRLVGTLPVIHLNFFQGLSLLINIDAHISKEFQKKIL